MEKNKSGNSWVGFAVFAVGCLIMAIHAALSDDNQD